MLNIPNIKHAKSEVTTIKRKRHYFKTREDSINDKSKINSDFNNVDHDEEFFFGKSNQ